MLTECRANEIDFGRAGGRRVVADFDGGMVSSDAGGLLLGETDKAIRLVDRFAACFRDRRHPAYVLHEVKTLVGQRVFGLALGYEDLVDRDGCGATRFSACCSASSSAGPTPLRRWPARAR